MKELPAEPRSWRLVSAALVGVLLLGGVLAWRVARGDDTVYSVETAERCVDRTRYEATTHAGVDGFVTLEITAPGVRAPVDVLTFAPTVGLAKAAGDSDTPARRGNVLSRAGFSDPLVDECLTEAGRE